MSSRPTAKIADGRFVLNLPDAETPALWVMDLAEAQASVIRLEADKGGLYVLKKHGNAKAETIAVYRNREAGIRAMNIATRALSRGSRSAGAAGSCDSRWACAGRIFTYFVMVWFLLWSINLTPFIMRLVLSPFVSFEAPRAAVKADAEIEEGDQAEVPEFLRQRPTTNAAPTGVPLSADDFLQQQSGDTTGK